jgi:hypothetical protein
VWWKGKRRIWSGEVKVSGLGFCLGPGVGVVWVVGYQYVSTLIFMLSISMKYFIKNYRLGLLVECFG